jgi:hypothetical protein
MASFFFAYALSGWRPWEHLADEGTLYYQATAMTMAGIVMGQVGAGLGWRTNLRSSVSIACSPTAYSSSESQSKWQ